jgi:hypothetical protein
MNVNFPERGDLWRDGSLFQLERNGANYYSRLCCSGRSPILGKNLVVSIYGAPPYVTVDPVAKKIGGIDLVLVKNIVYFPFLSQIGQFSSQINPINEKDRFQGVSTKPSFTVI